jgi:hypothetical protein
MTDIRFHCPICDQHLVIDSAGSGMTITCPNCQHPVAVPWLNSPRLKDTQRLLPFPAPQPATELQVDRH